MPKPPTVVPFRRTKVVFEQRAPSPPPELNYPRAEHVATLRRAKEAGLTSIWSGDLRRSPFLRENICFADREGFVELTAYELDQESGWNIKWLDHPELQ